MAIGERQLRRIALGLFALAASANPGMAETAVAEGRALTETYCSDCHAIGPDGESPHPQAPPFRTLHERYDVADLAEGLVEGLVSGHPDMPEFEFDPAQAEAIVEYLETLEMPAAQE